MPAPHIVIAGAGIGGLAAAVALARRGFSVTVVEKRTGFGETGAGIQITPNAGHVLEALDLGLAVKRVAVPLDRLVVRRWNNGASLAEMPMGTGPTPAPFRALRRTDLHGLLLDAARSLPGIRLVVGRGLREAAQTEDAITATFISDSGQSETVSALALVGADGLWSRTRELTGDAQPPTFTGYEAWRAVVPNGGNGASPVPEVTLHVGQGRHAVNYPVSGGRETNLVIIREATEAREGWSRDGDAAVLTSHLARAEPALRKLAAAAPQWQVWSLFDRPPAAMARGNIALLGDAAHPVLPFMAQGAALAIEDSSVLAHELTAHLRQGGASAAQAALAAYAKARQARVARVQEVSRGNGRAYHLSWPWSLARDLAMKRMGPDGMRSRNAWLYDWRQPA